MHRIIDAAWAMFTVATMLLAPAVAAADLHFDAVKVDLGDIRSSVPLARQFSFVNVGPESAELVEARPSCGCLKPRLEITRFQAGQRGVITLDVNTLGQPAGPHAWQVTLIYKLGDQIHEQRLEVSANVVTEVSVQPAAVTLVVEGSLTHELTLTDLRAKPLSITKVETTSAWLSAQAGPLVRDAFGNATSKIRLAVTRACPVGRHDERVVIHTDDPAYRELNVAVTVVKRAAACCTATPSEVTLAGGPRFVRLTDREDRPVVVEGVQAGHPALACHWAAGPEHQATVKVEIDLSHWDGKPLQTQVQVQISSPVREVVTIGVHLGN
jgi:hypothetical protein